MTGKVAGEVPETPKMTEGEPVQPGVGVKSGCYKTNPSNGAPGSLTAAGPGDILKQLREFQRGHETKGVIVGS